MFAFYDRNKVSRTCGEILTREIEYIIITKVQDDRFVFVVVLIWWPGRYILPMWYCFVFVFLNYSSIPIQSITDYNTEWMILESLRGVQDSMVTNVYKQFGRP